MSSESDKNRSRDYRDKLDRITLDRTVISTFLHDVKAPLRAVSVYTHILKQSLMGKTELDTDVAFSVVAISQRTEEIQLLLESFGWYVFLEAEAYIPKTATTRLIARSVGEIYGNKYQARSGKIVISDALPDVLLDPEWLKTIFGALIDNALKFNESLEPQVEIGYVGDSGLLPFTKPRTEGSEWGVFTVQDNGIGIPPEYSRQVFIPFERLNSKSRYSGSGLGLSICEKIVRKAGGWIIVDPLCPKGTLVLFTLPLAPQSQT